MTAQWPPDGVRLRHLLGRVGYAETWAAQRADGTAVVAKRVRCDLDTARRIDRISGAAASLGPHVVVATDVGQLADGVVLVAPYAAGRSLAELTAARSRITTGEAVTLLAPLARALAAAHARGLGHGAVTAANVVFRADGMPMVTDFGVRAAVAGRPVSAVDDVRMLARCGLTAVGGSEAPVTGPSDPADEPVVQLLRAVATGAAADLPGAAAFATELLRSARATPIRMTAAQPAGEPAASRSARDRRAEPEVSRAGPPRRLGGHDRRQLRLVLTAAAVAAAAALGIRWGSGTPAPAAQTLPAEAVHPAVHPAKPPPVAPPPPVATPRPDWPAVVRGLETTRAAALRAADPARLAAIYADATAARADRTTLRRLRSLARGLVGLRPAVRSVTLLDRHGATVRLAVVDAMSSYAVVAPGGRVLARVPASRPQRRVFTLRLTSAGWRVAAVRSGQASSAASAASMSS